jgi:hypothetical protein
MTGEAATGNDAWPGCWQAAVDIVGQDFGDDSIIWGADPVERTGIRRLLEAFEFDCALHYDQAIAIEHGYADIVAPASSVRVFAIPAMWEPGDDPIFTDPDKNAQPVRWPRPGWYPPVTPATSAGIITDLEWDFLLPVVVGDHVGIRNRRRLVACTPKELRIGKGAFVTIEQTIVNQRQEKVALTRLTSFNYNPAPGGQDRAG